MYFVNHPEMMLGKMVYDTSRFGEKSRYTACRIEEGTDLIPALKNSFESGLSDCGSRRNGR